METDTTERKELTQKQELFCQLFASDKEFFGNGTQSYIEAYDVDLSRKGAYAGARSSAYRLLTNADILKRIDELLEVAVLNNQFVDRQLAKLIEQDADFGVKLAAMKEYNALKQRITNKLDLTSDGKPIEPVTVRIINEPTRDTDTE